MGNVNKSFWILFGLASVLMMCFAFYQDTFVLYLVQDFQRSRNFSYDINGVLTSVTYLSAMIMGSMVQRWCSPVRALKLGLALLFFGMLLASSHIFSVFLFAIVLFMLGYGFVYPTVFFLIGCLDMEDAARRESHFTLAYIGLNVGAIVGAVLGGVSLNTHYHALSLILISMMILFFWILVMRNSAYLTYLTTIKPERTSWLVLSLGALGLLFFVLLMFAAQVQDLLVVLSIISVCIVFGIAWIERKNRVVAKKLCMLGLLSIVMVAFFTAYRLQDNTVVIYLQDFVNRQLLGVTLSTPIILGVNPLTILLIGPLMSLFWKRYGHTKINNPVLKVSMSLVLLAIGFLALIIGTQIGTPAAILWPILFLLFLSLGELVMGPTMFSMISQLASERWQLLLFALNRSSMAAAGLFATQLALWFNHCLTEQGASPQHVYMLIFSEVATGLLILGILTLMFTRNYRA